jgi:hypothetical protein
LVEAPIVAYRKGNRSEPALAGYQHFGDASDEPLKPYRSYPADLTSGPQRQSSLPDSLGGVERVQAEFDASLHCSIVGTCLTTTELRHVLDKLKIGATASDHELHALGVSLAGRREAGAKFLQKALDRRRPYGPNR